MPYRYLIENGLLLYPEKTEKLTIGVEGETMRLLPPTGSYEADERMDATGCYIMPGLIDPHLHPVYEDDLGAVSESAAFGGVTTLLHYASIKPGENPLDVVARMRDEGERTSRVDFGLHASFFDTKNQLGSIPELAARGVRSFKMFTAYEKLGWMTDDHALIRAFDKIVEAGGIACVHAENGRAVDYLEDKHRPLTADNFLATSPALLDKEAVFRTLCLAKLTGCPVYLPHISSRKALEALSLGREEGVKFRSETCPHYLAFSWNELKAKGPLGKLRPPIKDSDDREALWGAVEDTAIDTIGSDHAPKAKHAGDDFEAAPYGAPGVETILPVLWELGVNAHRITPFDLVRLCAENPAAIFGLAPRKGRLEDNADADLIVFDPTAKWTVTHANQHSKAPYTLYEGFTCRGKIQKVFSRGRLLVDGDAFIAPKTPGKFLETRPSL
ncbi:MAG: amidohydrolase family protein [Spirochaetales bacterium]|nr:amidohydrolase family protein [Spirochaetales bacterium]